MSKTLDRLTSFFEEFNESPQGDDSQHRLDLAEIMWRGLGRNGWTQRRLAKKSGLADADISNLLHGNKNFTSSTFGKVVNALGVKVKTQEVMYLGDEGGIGCGLRVPGQADTAVVVSLTHLRLPSTHPLAPDIRACAIVASLPQGAAFVCITSILLFARIRE